MQIKFFTLTIIFQIISVFSYSKNTDFKIDTLDPCANRGIFVLSHDTLLSNTALGAAISTNHELIIGTINDSSGYMLSKWRNGSRVWNRKLHSLNGTVGGIMLNSNNIHGDILLETRDSNDVQWEFSTVHCIDANGNWKWGKSIKFLNSSCPTILKVVTNGDFFYIIGNDFCKNNLHVIKLNSIGEVIAQSTFSITSPFSVFSISKLEYDELNNSILVAAGVFDEGGKAQSGIIRISKELELLNFIMVSANGSTLTSLPQILNVNGDGTYLAGYTLLDSIPLGLIVKTDHLGNIVFAKKIGEFSSVSAIQSDTSGLLHVGYSRPKLGGGLINVHLILDNNGMFLSANQYTVEGPNHVSVISSEFTDDFSFFYVSYDTIHPYRSLSGVVSSGYLFESNNCFATVSSSIPLPTSIPVSGTQVNFVASPELFQLSTVQTSVLENPTDTVLGWYVCKANPIHTNITQTICDGQLIQFGNQTISTNGVYSNTYTSTDGCDSIVSLSVLVIPSFLSLLIDTICQGESYQLGNQFFYSSGQHTVTISATNGCDSILQVQLTLLPLSDSTCISEIYNPNIGIGVKVSPSPFNDYIKIKCLSDFPLTYELRNISGQTVRQSSSSGLTNEEVIETTELLSGVYMLIVISEDKQHIFKLVKAY
jgi:Secretion system C-terminal sorting domain